MAWLFRGDAGIQPEGAWQQQHSWSSTQVIFACACSTFGPSGALQAASYLSGSFSRSCFERSIRPCADRSSRIMIFSNICTAMLDPGFTPRFEPPSIPLRVSCSAEASLTHMLPRCAPPAPFPPSLEPAPEPPLSGMWPYRRGAAKKTTSPPLKPPDSPQRPAKARVALV